MYNNNNNDSNNNNYYYYKYEIYLGDDNGLISWISSRFVVHIKYIYIVYYICAAVSEHALQSCRYGGGGKLGYRGLEKGRGNERESAILSYI